MRDQHQRAAIFQQALLQYFQRGNVEIVGRLVEEQHVRRLQHELRDQYARTLATREFPDGLVQMLGIKEKPCRPRSHVNHAVLINHGIAVGRQRAAQTNVGIQHAILVEVHDPQGVRLADFAARWRNVASQQAQQRGLAASVRAHKSHSHPRRDGEMNPFKQCAIADGIRKVFQLDQPLGLPVRR